MKKNLIFISTGALILLIGAIAGWVISNYYFESHKEKICALEKKINVEFSPEQIQNITSLKSGQVIYGKVDSKQGNQISLNVQLINPLDQKDIKAIPVNVPINAKDEIVKFKSGSGSNLETVKASFDEIKIGDYVIIQILPDRKVIGLPIIEK